MATGTIKNPVPFETANFSNGSSVIGTVYKFGRIVCGTIYNGSKFTEYAQAIIATMPQGFAPAYTYDFRDSYGNNRYQIEEGTGKLSVRVQVTDTFIRGSFCYISAD